MPFCSNCGSWVNKGERNCPSCGLNPDKKLKERDTKVVTKKALDTGALSKITVVAFIFLIEGLLVAGYSLMEIGEVGRAYESKYEIPPKVDSRPLLAIIFIISLLCIVEGVLLLEEKLSQRVFYFGMILSAIIFVSFPFGIILGFINIYLLSRNKTLFGL